jgi:Acetyltransferase (GNAT) domain
MTLRIEDSGLRKRSSGKLIGWCSISYNSWTKRFTSAEIGLAIGEKDRWRKGYGTEIVGLLLKECVEQLNLHRTSWWTFADNKASIALAEKMGFKEEGRLRENVFFDNAFHDTVVLVCWRVITGQTDQVSSLRDILALALSAPGLKKLITSSLNFCPCSHPWILISSGFDLRSFVEILR